MSYRRLARMAEARMKDEWERTSFVLAKIHNVNVTRDADAVTPASQNPTLPKPKPVRIEREQGIQIARAIFVPQSLR